MIAQSAMQQLEQALGKEKLVTAKEDLLVLGYDSTPGLHATPDLVVYPTSTDDVVKVVEVARDHNLPLTPRGSATGLRGEYPDQWRHRHLSEQDEPDSGN